MGKEPDKPVFEIDLLTVEQRGRLLYDFNDTHAPFPSERTLHDLFSQQAAATPENIAVRGTRDITYRQLDERSNRIARYLCDVNDRTVETTVGVLMYPCDELPETILGILKSGAAYVPLEPSLPEERIGSIIRDACIDTVIGQKQHIRTLNRLQWDIPCFRGFLCPDSSAVDEEQETESNQLMDEKLWAYVGETAVDDITGGGWLSSYTGEPFTREEMDEYADNVLAKLEPLLHRNREMRGS